MRLLVIEDDKQTADFIVPDFQLPIKAAEAAAQAQIKTVLGSLLAKLIQRLNHGTVHQHARPLH